MSESIANQDVVEDNGLNDEICQKLVEDFVGFTATNEALAQMFLQENEWVLEKAVENYFKDTGGDLDQNSVTEASTSDVSIIAGPSGNNATKATVVTLEDSSGDEGASSSTTIKTDHKELIFITFNIDGLSDRNRELRTKAVCKIILDTKADIIFLQEVIHSTAEIIREQLAVTHEIISGEGYKNFPSKYFTLSLFRKDTVKLNSHKVIDYELSVMTRNMLTANVTINGVTINLLNTHLESTKDYSSIRITQFQECYYEFVKKCSKDEPVIIAGDLNMRDKELADAGGLPPDLIDVWVATGSKRECEFTWDMTRNDNLDANFGKYRPRCRFDRILLREPPFKLIPTHFNLIGIERLKPHVCFPSDHWGILCIFKTF